MAINTKLLISAPMLQDYLVDKDNGQPLSAGIVSMYKDNSRTTYKNWYYQTGVPGNYTYIPLPNPMTLSAVGTITDGNGNDVIPFYYPYSESDNTTSEPYYVNVTNSNGEQQFTRQNFPFNPNASPTPNNVDTLDNLIINGEFWRNFGSMDLTTLTPNINTGLLSAVICPSQHDGYTMPDIQFIKNANGASDTIAFNKFISSYPDQVLPDGITPEFYLNFNCTGTGTETSKYIQIPVQLHVDSLSGVQATFVLYAMAVNGSPSITISVYQYLGTGTSNNPSTLQTIVLNNNWSKYTISFTVPSAQNLVLGQGQDDAIFMQIGLPVSTSGVAQINLAMPGFFLGTEVPTNYFSTYDDINAIISSPRTGDFRTSINTFQPYGWVAANDGTIGNSSSSATTRANNDTWPLYQLIYNTIIDAFAPVSGGRTGNAYNDFSSNKRITLSRTLDRALIGANAVFNATVTFTANSGTDILTLSTSSILTIGTPILVQNTGGALPAPLSANVVYYISRNNLTPTTVKLSGTLEDAFAGNDINITTNGTGTQTMRSANGATIGASQTSLTISNIPAHNHPGSVMPFQSVNVQGGGMLTVVETPGGVSGNYPLNIASQGSGTPVSLFQPSTYQNIFIKL